MAKEIPTHPDYMLNHLPSLLHLLSHFIPHGPYLYPSSWKYYSQGFRPTEQPHINDPAIDDLTLFPFISDWLLGFDQEPCGTDSHNFAQYIQYFKDNKIQCIFEIANLTLFSCDDILAICPGMKIEIAYLLLKYVCEDEEAIHNNEWLQLWETKQACYF